jgi:hypothetical protein
MTIVCVRCCKHFIREPDETIIICDECLRALIVEEVTT